MNSKFAQQVAKDKQKQMERRKTSTTARDGGEAEKKGSDQEDLRGEDRDEAIEENAASQVDNVVNHDMAERN